MFSSIRVRLMFSHLTVIIVAMGLSGFLLLGFLENYFMQATEDSLIAQAHITAQVLIPGAMVGTPLIEANAASNTIQQQQFSNINVQTANVVVPTDSLSPDSLDLGYLTDASLQLGTQLETRVRILDIWGIVLVDSDQTESNADMHDNPLVARALNDETTSQRTDANGQSVMSIALPVKIEDELVGVVYLSQPLRDVMVVLQDLREYWLLSTIVALILSSGVGLLLARFITNPIRQLTLAAGEVAQGHFDQQVPASSRDELGQLSRTFNDMTARLRAARQMQVDFVANVSHELRTPLTAVKATIETLRDGAINDGEVRDQFLETIETETERLIRLVNDLLLLSRADSEALNLRREVINPAELVKGIVDKLVVKAQSCQLNLELDTNGQTAPVWVDSDKIEQVLLNLLDNAIKYSRPGGAVTVKVDKDADHDVLVQICDNGIGIPVSDLSRIGQRFYRADKARLRSKGGSGLGLAIARSLVQAHGGKLWLESEYGAGVTACFTLPLAG
jgi:signal transduction histidine kinase